jgi:CubicO group peptidase (beta-lactamase class C family)
MECADLSQNISHFPPSHPLWESATPENAGLASAPIAAAVRHAAEHETPWGRDLKAVIESDFDEQPPWNKALGPVRPRGGPNGLIIRHGKIVGEWGDTHQIDLTFSVAKSYLSILAGLAVDRGLIRDVDEPVRRTVDDGGFEPPHNQEITWHHLLQQTSEWEGTLWDKPDLIDRHRSVGGRPKTGVKGTHRDLQPPGSLWEYNDVRVNRLSLALLRVWRRPLPEVFRELVMDPIGASRDWEWHGYDNSYVEIDGRRVQSVSGGSHWGGGIFIHARDQARIGLLMAHGGIWGSQRILSQGWIERMLEPCPLFAQYGYLWWLNTDHGLYSSAPASGYCARGAGGNLTWIDAQNDLVAVLRWTDPAAAGEFLKLVMQAIG